MSFRSFVRARFVTADAVYGTILYSALIAGISDDNESALEVLLISAFSLLVFWGAHVFAGTVATHGVRDGVQIPLRAAALSALSHSIGMLYAAILPSVALVLGAVNLVSTDDAVTLALLVATVILGILGYQAFAQRRSPVIIRILGGIGTALFGFLMIALNVIVH